jgi:hypothetical protein
MFQEWYHHIDTSQYVLRVRKMAYEDVPQRLRDGENVPRSEIIGHYGPTTDIKITLALEILTTAQIMVKVFEDDTVKYGLTALGMSIRADLITRLEGDCPECPECP